MTKWLLLALSLLLLAWGSLTILRAPNLFAWKLAILAGEFGHWIAIISLLVAVSLLAFGKWQSGGWISRATIIAYLSAVGLLLSPVIRAQIIADSLAQNLNKAFRFLPVRDMPLNWERLWKISGPSQVKVETLSYGEAGGEKRYLDFYSPSPAQSESVPCVIMIHGGGWDSGTRDELSAVNREIAHLGYAIASIDYRLAPKNIWPAPREDVVAALGFLEEHANVLHIDPRQFVLMGRSAGGQIAVACAYTLNDPRIKGAVSLYGPHDLLFAWKYGSEDDVLNSLLLLRNYLGGKPETALANFESASGYLHVDKTVPPTLLVHGAIDTLVWNKQSERLDARLAEAGVPHYFLSIPWGVHAFDFNINGPSAQLTLYALKYFLAGVTTADKK